MVQAEEFVTNFALNMMGLSCVVVLSQKSAPTLCISAFVLEERKQDPRRGKRPAWNHPDSRYCALACMTLTEFTLDPIVL